MINTIDLQNESFRPILKAMYFTKSKNLSATLDSALELVEYIVGYALND